MKQHALNTKHTSQPLPHPSPLLLLPQPQFSILIAGAGIGGLIMGLMLEQAEIPFLILERTSTIHPTGGAISLCPNVMRAMDQLGLMNALMKESVPIRQIRYYDSMKGAVSVKNCDAVTDMLFCKTRYGNAIRTIPRPVFINLLLARVPRHKILLGKRVIRTEEATLESLLTPDTSNPTGYITCYCDDGSEYQGSILVGADGTYSAVRKSMYQKLYKSGILDGEEKEEAKKGGEAGGMKTVDEKVMPHQHGVVGITQPLDSVEFKSLGGEYGEFQVLRGADHEHSIWLMPLTNYRIAWNVFFHFPEDILQEYKDLQSSATTVTNTDKSTIEGSQFSFPGQYKSHLTTPKPQQPQQQQHHNGASWQSVGKRVHDRAQAALESLRDIPNPLSTRQGRFGDLLDKTDSDKISKVTLEQGVFGSWFHGRTVLIGDAAHKSLPYAGQGANQAILDSIALVGKIYLLIKPAVVAGEVAPKMSLVAHRPMATRFCLTSPGPKSNELKLRLKSKPIRLSPITTATLTTNTKWYIPQLFELVKVFQDYYAERSVMASQATWGASWADTIFGGQGPGASLARFAFFKLLPIRLFYAVSDPYFEVQPVLSFLPDVAGGRRGGAGREGIKAKKKSRRPRLIRNVGASVKSALKGWWGAFPILFQ